MNNAAVIIAIFVSSSASAQRSLSASDSIDAGIRLFNERMFDEASAMLRPFESRSIPTGDVSFLLGRLSHRAKDYPRAIELFERAVAADTTRSGYHMWLGRALVQQAVAGSKFKLPFLARRGKKEGERAIALAPDSVQPRFDMLQYALAAPSIMGGGVDRARHEADEIARRNPYWGHLARAKIADHERAFVESERELRAAIAVHPDSGSARIALAQSLFTQKRYDEAMVEANEIFARQIDEPFAYYGVGMIGGWQPRLAADGLRALRTYLALRPKEEDPPFASAHYWMGIIHRNARDTVQARQEFATALALDPRQARAAQELKRLGAGR